MQKNAHQSILISLYKAQVQVDQEPPHKTRYTETSRTESGNEPQTHEPQTQGKFPDKIPMAYALISRIDKWDFIKLLSFCKAKETVNRTNRNQQTWKRSKPILHLVEG